MLSFIKRHIFIILIFIFTLSVTFLTFLTFIGKSFILINENNLNYLLYANIGLLLFFFVIIFREISSSIKNNINVICEKPLTINFKNLLHLKNLEKKSKKKISCILQLRLHREVKKIINKKKKIKNINKT